MGAVAADENIPGTSVTPVGLSFIILFSCIVGYFALLKFCWGSYNYRTVMDRYKRRMTLEEVREFGL